MGTHRIQVIVCNVPTDLSGDVLAAFLSSYRILLNASMWQEATLKHLAKFCPQRSKESNQQVAEPKIAAVENAADI